MRPAIMQVSSKQDEEPALKTKAFTVGCALDVGVKWPWMGPHSGLAVKRACYFCRGLGFRSQNHFRQLTTACDSSCRGSGTLWPLQLPTHMWWTWTHEGTHTQAHKLKNKYLKWPLIKGCSWIAFTEAGTRLRGSHWSAGILTTSQHKFQYHERKPMKFKYSPVQLT